MSLKDNYISAWESLPFSIASGQALSEAVNLGGLRLFGIVMPSAWTSANLTFQMSPDGGTSWVNIKDQYGGEISAAAAANDCVVLDPAQFAAFQHLRVRSGTSASPVTQTAERAIRFILRGV